MNYIFLGEAGSGKSELSINLALELTEKTNATDQYINLIDLDQTKSIFRTRELSQRMSKKNVNIYWGEQLLDAHVVADGIIAKINDKDNYCIIDVGGNVSGAIQLGQFSDELKKNDTSVFYCINPYRPFCNTDILTERIRKIKVVSGVDNINIICNPNFGEHTSAKDVLEGIATLENVLNKTKFRISHVAVSEWLYEEVKNRVLFNTIKIKQYIIM